MSDAKLPSVPASRSSLGDGKQAALNCEQLQALNNQLSRANADLQAKLDAVLAKNNALDKDRDGFKRNFDQSLALCYQVIAAFDPLLGEQTRGVVDVCQKMAETEHFTEQEKHVLIASAWLHDIGLVGYDRAVLHKLHSAPGTLTASELESIRQHPVAGQALAAFVDNLRGVGETIRAHHESFDGRGYPDGLAGETIPWTARCLAVAVYFVECNLPKTQALQAILKQSGTGFDPDAVRLFFKVTQAADLPRQVREVMIDELTPGMCLAKGIFSPAGLLLVPEGQPLNSTTIAKIKNYNLLTSVTGRLLVYS